VTTVYGNVAVEQATTNLLAVLESAGRRDIPVAAGAAVPLKRPRVPRRDSRHGDDGLGGARLPTPSRGPVSQPPGELLATLVATGGPVELLAIGPLTNVATLVGEQPDMLSRIVVMGGRFDDTATAEFNIASDPEAAERVFSAAGVPVVLVPYDVTSALTETLHDVIAAVALVQPELTSTVERAVLVDVYASPGLTSLATPGRAGRRPVTVLRRIDLSIGEDAFPA
jgi:inosine-uridine nucleoside N-ribohydrolase